MVFSGWLPANSALHGGKAVPAKPTLRMDTGEGAKVSWRERCGVDELGKRPKRLENVGNEKGDIKRPNRCNTSLSTNRGS